jgi:hypothetical protein
MNYENFLIIFSISISDENCLQSGFNFNMILVPLSKPIFSTSDTSNSPDPSETHLTPGCPSTFEKTSTVSATMKLE